MKGNYDDLEAGYSVECPNHLGTTMCSEGEDEDLYCSRAESLAFSDSMFHVQEYARQFCSDSELDGSLEDGNARKNLKISKTRFGSIIQRLTNWSLGNENDEDDMANACKPRVTHSDTVWSSMLSIPRKGSSKATFINGNIENPNLYGNTENPNLSYDCRAERLDFGLFSPQQTRDDNESGNTGKSSSCVRKSTKSPFKRTNSADAYLCSYPLKFVDDHLEELYGRYLAKLIRPRVFVIGMVLLFVSVVMDIPSWISESNDKFLLTMIVALDSIELTAQVMYTFSGYMPIMNQFIEEIIVISTAVIFCNVSVRRIFALFYLRAGYTNSLILSKLPAFMFRTCVYLLFLDFIFLVRNRKCISVHWLPIVLALIQGICLSCSKIPGGVRLGTHLGIWVYCLVGVIAIVCFNFGAYMAEWHTRKIFYNCWMARRKLLLLTESVEQSKATGATSLEKLIGYLKEMEKVTTAAKSLEVNIPDEMFSAIQKLSLLEQRCLNLATSNHDLKQTDWRKHMQSQGLDVDIPWLPFGNDFSCTSDRLINSMRPPLVQSPSDILTNMQNSNCQSGCYAGGTAGQRRAYPCGSSNGPQIPRLQTGSESTDTRATQEPSEVFWRSTASPMYSEDENLTSWSEGLCPYNKGEVRSSLESSPENTKSSVLPPSTPASGCQSPTRNSRVSDEHFKKAKNAWNLLKKTVVGNGNAENRGSENRPRPQSKPSSKITQQTPYPLSPSHSPCAYFRCNCCDITSQLLPPDSPKLPDIGNVFSIDMYKIEDITNGNALVQVGYSLLRQHTFSDFTDKFSPLPPSAVASEIHDQSSSEEKGHCVLGCSTSRLLNFLTTIQNQYRKNSYHNSVHAALVAHMAKTIAGMFSLFAPPCRPPKPYDTSPSKLENPCEVRTTRQRALDEVAYVVACLGHDAGHPGRNNMFLVHAEEPLALVYNDNSVLENYHAYLTFWALNSTFPAYHCCCQKQTQCSVGTSGQCGDSTSTAPFPFGDCVKPPQISTATNFAIPSSCCSAHTTSSSNILEFVNPVEYRYMRKCVIEWILATDMTQHFTCISNFRVRRTSPKFDIYQNHADFALAATLCLKAADIGHAALDWPQHYDWCQRVIEEFYAQGDEELRRGLVVSPLCDRAQHGEMPKSQCGFIQYVVMPLISEVEQLALLDDNEELKDQRQAMVIEEECGGDVATTHEEYTGFLRAVVFNAEVSKKALTNLNVWKLRCCPA